MITTIDGLRYGQLVRSVAGRDNQQYYLISGFIKDHYIEVVDGNKHSIMKPKKKNVKHVKIEMLVAKDIEDRIDRGESITDSQIDSAIRKLKNELEEGDRFNGETRCHRSRRNCS